MKLKMFSVFDSKIQAYMNPFFARTAAEALRSFADAVNNSESNFCRFAEDFTLFEIGAWDDQTAKVELLPTPHSLGVAIQFLKSATPELPKALNRGVVEVVK